MATAYSKPGTPSTLDSEKCAIFQQEHSNITAPKFSLSRLPQDILYEIIQQVSLSTEQDRHILYQKRTEQARIVWADGHKRQHVTFLHDKTPILSALQALGSTNRQFYELCRPWFWNRLYFPTTYDIPAAFFIQHIFPKHGTFFKSLSIGVSLDFTGDPRPLTCFETVAATVENTKSFHGLQAKVTPMTMRVKKESGFFGSTELISDESARQLILLCPNLRTLTIQFSRSLHGTKAAKSKSMRNANIQTFFLNILTHHPQLEKLVVNRARGLEITDHCMGRLISRLPFLRSLSLSHLTSSASRKDEECFGLRLSELKNLTELKLFHVDAIHESWCKHNWSRSIKVLRLGSLNIPSLTHLHQLIQAMAPNLQNLKLGYDGVRYADSRAADDINAPWPDIRFDLPMLTDLTIGKLNPSDLTVCFSNCQSLQRIKYLCLKPREWLALTNYVPRSTWPKLRSINLRNTEHHVSSGQDNKQFEEYCKNSGIELILPTDRKILQLAWDSEDSIDNGYDAGDYN
ncbi:hypothetical protein CROQUDRAFT_659913 [Cronartium quercuum f. sp. fusiforme G11]|uniref:F-box domain-containing protein n=1 Tax=Cronartium quercuum f. sp. fusiforme G11 TaxID=708437 RepID=A0A9P6NI58_9BASI|nr:hypothetical protein CROQUDRAFT_659913 [Cronartium quercuum f. sp. fusiforme G11]